MYFKSFWRFYLIFISLIFGSINSYSQKNESEKIKTDSLREVTVIENKKSNEIRSTSPLQILSSKTLSQLNALQVSDAVKYFSGVTVKDYGGIGGLKTVSVRSLGANHTSIAYDGITLSDMQTGQIDIGRFSLENVDMLTLNNGQSDNIFQPARSFSSASSINIKTLKPTFEKDEKTNGNFSFKTGSLGLINPSFYIHQKFNKKLTSLFSGEYLYADGKYPYTLYYGSSAADSSSLEKRKNTDVHNFRLESTLYAQFDEKSDGYFKAYYYSSERGLPGATIYYNTENFSSQRIWDNTFFTQAHFQRSFSSKWEIQANAKYNRGHLRYIDPTTLNSSGETENNYTQQELYGSFSSIYRVLEHLSFSASTDAFINSLDADIVDFSYPTRFTSLTVLAGKYVKNRFLATSSILYTLTNEKVKWGNPAQNQQKISPYASFSVQPFSKIDLRIRAFYKNIFRLPTFNDLYYSRIGNRDLLPESANQFDAGATFLKETSKWIKYFSFTGDVYHNNVKNKIVAYPTKNIFQWTMLNYGKVNINGLDISTETALELNKHINLILGYSHSYQRALNVTNPENRDYNHQIPYTPRVSGSGRASLETAWFSVNYSMLWSGHRYAVNQNYTENRVEGYTDHNISISKNIKTTFGVIGGNFEILNLMNKNYEVVRFFPMPGRTFRANISLKF
ncbi:conserved hypothetical protein [uncultured Paludibacter sp.]|uniref:TonB-dependent receptor plug domain-containing protein n=1 Tax=uncultured Paludibacter sp. TaxID=497635 RepID=A0A653AEF5_9BACT|nr:conserved hypothetical protein [uncultured Paludibacter sp.]